MPVAHLSVPAARSGALMGVALTHGVEVESVDYTDGDTTLYVDANGTPLSLLLLIQKSGAKFHGITRYVNDDASAPAGISGEGIPNSLNAGDKYGRLMSTVPNK